MGLRYRTIARLRQHRSITFTVAVNTQ